MAVVRCPLCGQEKWTYLGKDLPWEPPCAPCMKVLAEASFHPQPRIGAADRVGNPEAVPPPR